MWSERARAACRRRGRCSTRGACDVVLHEAQPHPGGRRRSFSDAVAGPRLRHRRLSHSLVLDLDARADRRGRARAREWRDGREARRRLRRFRHRGALAAQPNAGRWPWWLLDPRRRGPNLRFADYWSARRLLSRRPGRDRRERRAERRSAMERLWRPLTLAALNCPPETASARLLGAVFREVVEAGGARPAGPDAEQRIRPRVRRAGGAQPRARRRDAALRAAAGRPRADRGPRREPRLRARPHRSRVRTTRRSWRRPGRRRRRSRRGRRRRKRSTRGADHPFRRAAAGRRARPSLGALNGPFDWLFADRRATSRSRSRTRKRASTRRATQLADGLLARGRGPHRPLRRLCRPGGSRPSRRAAALATPAGDRPPAAVAAPPGATSSWPAAMSDGTCPTASRTPSARARPRPRAWPERNPVNAGFRHHVADVVRQRVRTVSDLAVA